MENDSNPVYVRHSNTPFAQVTVGLSLPSDMWHFLKAIKIQDHHESTRKSLIPPLNKQPSVLKQLL